METRMTAAGSLGQASLHCATTSPTLTSPLSLWLQEAHICPLRFIWDTPYA